jgi:hypothetical protein
MNHEEGDAVNLVISAPPCTVEVLNPSFRITASKSAFCNGFESDATKTPLGSVVSLPLYALMDMIGVVVFLLFVFLIY